MTINLYHLDIVIFSLFLPMMLIFGSSHEEQIYRAVIVMSCGIYAIARYPFLKCEYSILSRKGLIFWIVSFFLLYLFYGNFYMADAATFGSNSSAFLLLMFLCTVILFFTPYKNDRLMNMLEISFCIALLVYIFYIINDMKSMTVEQMVLYRVGEKINGESVVNGNSNTVSLTVSMLSIFLFYEVFVGQHKIIAAIPLVFSMIVILFTGSKAGFFSIILYILMNICLFSHITLNKIFALCIAVGLLIYIVFNNEYMYLLLGTRVEDFLSSIGVLDMPVVGDSTNIRGDMYVKGMEMWMDSPMFGNGLGAFTAYSGYHMYSHNTYTEILSSFGLIGFVVFYFLPIVTFYKALIYRKENVFIKIALMLSIIGFFFDTASIKFLSYMSMLVVIAGYIFVNNYECDHKK